jgi:hypothetical protein
MNATPEQLRAMWAAIPGVDFNPKRRRKRPKPITYTRNKENCNKSGRPRKYPTGHPGSKWYSINEALDLLQMKRANFLYHAKKHRFIVEKRVLINKNGNYNPASSFYLKSEIRNFHKQRKQHHENT